MQQQMVLPEGGLASFLTSNLDEMDDSRLAFGSQNGINSMRETAERMAKMGRGGDDVIIHAKTRERLIPQEVSDGNPELMSQVDIAIANAGADPSAYIIGSETNSINPYTGQREFFLKKLIRGVKNVFKKLAPIIVPIALNFIAPGLGSIASGFIGSGITALAQGKNFKDSLKAGLIGGVLGGISSGMKGVMAKGEGVKGNMFERFGQGFEQGALPDLSEGASSMFKLGPADDSTMFGKPYDVEAGNKAIAGGNTPVMDKLSGTFYNDPVDAVGPDVQGAVNTLNATGKPFEMADAITLANQSVTAAVPGSIKYIPTIAAGSALAYGLGAFDEIPAAEIDDPYDGPSASERRLANFPRRYSTDVPVAGMGANMDDIMVPYAGEQMAQPLVQVAQPLEEQYPDLYKQYLAQMQPQFAAAGGQMESFPRRTGYIAGPGTETSDDIPAMLSDGELVMNAKAVRGAGNGSREQGVRNMYSMMRAFEGGAVA
jgi:hypothetical protein